MLHQGSKEYATRQRENHEGSEEKLNWADGRNDVSHALGKHPEEYDREKARLY